MNKFWMVMCMKTPTSTIYCAFRQHPHIREFDSNIYYKEKEAIERCKKLNEGYSVVFTEGRIPIQR